MVETADPEAVAATVHGARPLRQAFSTVGGDQGAEETEVQGATEVKEEPPDPAALAVASGSNLPHCRPRLLFRSRTQVVFRAQEVLAAATVKAGVVDQKEAPHVFVDRRGRNGQPGPPGAAGAAGSSSPSGADGSISGSFANTPINEAGAVTLVAD